MAKLSKSATKRTTKRGSSKKSPTKKVATKASSKKTKAKRKNIIIGDKNVRSLAEAGVVILNIEFREVSAENSLIKASCNGEISQRTSSGPITFSGIKRDDIISIDGSSSGKTTIDISVAATPQQMNFPPGNFNDNFLID